MSHEREPTFRFRGLGKSAQDLGGSLQRVKLDITREPPSAFCGRPHSSNLLLCFYLILPGTAPPSGRNPANEDAISILARKTGEEEREDNERAGMIYACHLKQFRTLLSSRPLGTSFKSNLPLFMLVGSIDNSNEQRLCKSNYAVERPARRRVRMIQCHCTEGA